MEKLLILWSMTKKKNESIRSFNSALTDDERFSISMVRLLMEMEKSYPSLESFLHHQHNANITWNGIQQDITANSDLRSGTKGWFPLGDCGLSVAACGSHELLSGHCIHATNRAHTWMGPAQLITDKVKLFVTYQVSAWVRLVATGSPQNVNVALGVDDQWLNAGQVEADDDKWHEICGSFRIEKPAGKVMVYIQGPAPGISFMVARFQIFVVDRQERFRHLKHQTDKNSRRNRG